VTLNELLKVVKNLKDTSPENRADKPDEAESKYDRDYTTVIILTLTRNTVISF
jgi:hypothetical protein